MRTLIIAVTLLMLFSVGQAQEPLPVPIEPREGAMAVSQVQKLAPPDAGRFGASIAVNGETPGSILVVGAPATLVNSIGSAGAAFVYRMDSARNWQFWQRIVAPQPTVASFGWSVDITGVGADTRIAVGAPGHDLILGSDGGQAYVFSIQDDVWILEQVIDDPLAGTYNHSDVFGTAVTLSGTGDEMILAVSEPGKSRIHIFVRAGTSWSYQTTLLPPDDQGSNLGKQMDLIGSGNNALLAAVSGPNAGYVYLFSRPTGSWQPEQKLASDGSYYNNYFATDVAISGPAGQRIIVVGAPGEHQRGSVYIFRHNGTEWLSTQKILHTLTEYYSLGLGFAVAVTGNASDATIFAGLPGYDTPTDSGRILRYRVTPTVSTLVDTLGPADAFQEYEFGRSVAAAPDGAGNIVFGGRELYSTGSVYIFGNEAGVLVSPGAITVIEGSLGTSYVVSLSKAPTADVTITADPADGCDVGAGVGQPVTRTLTPANWGNPQTITVQAPPDNMPEAGSICLIAHSAASADGAYNGIAVSTVHASVYDTPMDLADIGLMDYDSVSVAEGGVSDSYSISLLSKPSSSVQVQALPDAQCDLGAGAGQAVAFDFSVATWQTPATVTVIAADDALDEGAHTCLISHSVSGSAEYDGMSVPNVLALIADNDTPPVYLADITLTNHQNVAVIEGGGNDSYSISLVYEPAYAVQIQALPDAQCDLGAGAGQAVTFDYAVAAWQTPAVVTVNAVDDGLNEGTHTCTISHSVNGPVEYAGMAVPNVTATITDNDAANLIANGDFESGVAPWTVKNKTGDKVLCDTATRSVAYAGLCAFRFKGGIGENAALIQNVDLTGVTFGVSDALRLQAMINGGAAAKGKLKLRVLFTNGEDTVVKLALPTTGVYALTESAWLLLDSPDVQAITVTVQHKSAKGKVWVDNVALWHRPVIVLRGVPEAVDGFRAP